MNKYMKICDYRGYQIEVNPDGLFNINESNGDFIDGNFESVRACKHIIDVIIVHQEEDEQQ